MRLVGDSLRAFPLDWSEIVFNPSMPYRLAHMLVASGLTAAFLMAGLSAYRLLKKDHKPAPRLALKTAVISAALLMPLQILLGDLHGLNSLQHQPAKIAAVEAAWNTEKGAPLVLFAIPDKETRTNKYAIEIPKLASIILTHDPNGEVKGLNEFADAHPPVTPLFYGFRIMLGTGVLMLIVSWLGCYQYWRHKEISPLLLKVFVGMTFSGWIATLAGWYVTEIGRQPWLVQGVLPTAAAATQRDIPIGTSLTLYLLLYVALIVAYISVLYYMAGKGANQPPDEREPQGTRVGEAHGT
jgi:cytochrome d ubiquinol oxidase subunit I